MGIVLEAMAKEDMSEHNLMVHCIFEGVTSEEPAKKSLGVETDDDGNAKTNGKEAKKTTADGKEPPGGDAKIGPKNPLANTTDKPKIHDKKLDPVCAIGTDDGEEEMASDPKAKKGTN